MGGRGLLGVRAGGRRLGAIAVPTVGVVFFVAASSGPAPTRTSGDVAVTRAALAASVRVPDWRTLGTFLAPEPHLRVGILPDARGVSIAAASGVVVLPLGRDGAPEGDGFEVPRASFVPAADAGRLRLLEAAVVLASAAVVPAMPGEALSADGAPYRGYLEVAAEDAAVRVVNVVNVEDYLRGVVPNELSPGAGPEAVKAQAVAARTYALRQRGDYSARGYDLCATPACQVYRGRASEHPRADRAVAETRGLVVQYDGTPIKALYTSACGGHTENVENVFVGERERPYLRGVACTRERAAHVPGLGRLTLPDVAAEAGGAFDSGSRRWQVRMSPSDVARALSRIRPLSDVRDLQLRRVSKAGRVVELAVIGDRQREELVLKGLDVRKGLGLRENLFVVDRDTDARGSVRGFVFTGQGWGHGVGLCQKGAVGMARDGARFEQILTHYYTGVTLEKAY